MRFREVKKNIERITEEDIRERERREQYKKIKPESDITIEESRMFWDSVFMNGEES